MEENNEEKIDLTKYFDRFYKAFMRLKKLILIIMVAFVAFFEVKTLLFFDTVYSSQAIFIASTGEQENIYVTNGDDDFISTISNVMTGSMMRKVIMKDLGVQAIPANISISLVPETNLIELKATSSSSEDAYNVVNCIINNYTQVTDVVMSDLTLSVLDAPVIASQPDAFPNYLNAGLKGIVVGGALCFIITCIVVLFRRTILGKEDIKDILHLDNIAKVPYIPYSTKNYSKKSHLLLSNPRIQYGFQKAFHDIRLKIEQENKKKRMKTFLVTSTMPNEGKTMISTNIGISLAQKGYHVVLVDLDLRNPSIFNTVNVSHVTGNIIDYLNGNFVIEEITNQYLDYSLDIIYGFKTTDVSPELLSQDKFKEFINLLKEKYDYVILDVPPLYMMEDALLIAEQCDSAIVTIKQDYAEVYDVLDALEELNEHVSHITGTVLNQVKPSPFDHEQVRYGYGYGYGYGKR